MSITDDICPICFGDLLWIGDMDSYYCDECDVRFTREELDWLSDTPPYETHLNPVDESIDFGDDWLSEPDE